MSIVFNRQWKSFDQLFARQLDEIRSCSRKCIKNTAIWFGSRRKRHQKTLLKITQQIRRHFYFYYFFSFSFFFFSLRIGGEDLYGILGILRIRAHRSSLLLDQLPSSLFPSFPCFFIRLAVGRRFWFVDWWDATFCSGTILRNWSDRLFLRHGLEKKKKKERKKKKKKEKEKEKIREIS